MTTRSLSAVCYLTLAGEREQELLLYVDGLLDSLGAYWDDPDPLALAFVSPEAELPFFYRAIGPVPGVAFTFVTEEQLSPSLARDRSLPSEQREMVARLLYAANGASDFCLTLEPGLFCIRSINAAGLLPQGRARTEWENKSKHADWWRASTRVLARAESRETAGLGVCPAVLAKDLARRTLDAVAKVHGQDPVRALASAAVGARELWTDNTLYCLANEGPALLEWHWERGAQPDDRANRLHSDVNLWGREDLRGWDPAGWKSLAAHGEFVIVNRRAGLAPEEALPTLYKTLNLHA